MRSYFRTRKLFSVHRSLYKVDEEKVTKAYAKTNETFIRLSSILMLLSFFCLHTTLDSSDKELLITSSLALPFRLGYVSFQLFLLLGPITLVLLRSYIQVYYEHIYVLERIIAKKNFNKIPILSLEDNFLLKIVKDFNLYLLIPITMFFFVEKSSAIPVWGGGMAFYTAIVISLHIFFFKRNFFEVRYTIHLALMSLLAISIAAILFFSLKPKDGLLRPMNLKNADLCHCNLTEHYLERADLEEADLREAKLWRANLKNAKMSYTNLTNAQLWRAELYGANLHGATLTNGNLFEANLTYCNLENAQLKNANLKNANLSGSNLRRAYLKYAKLDNAVLSYVTIHDAVLSGARLNGADLSKTIGLTQKMLEKTFGDRTTILPKDLHYPEIWIESIEEEE